MNKITKVLSGAAPLAGFLSMAQVAYAQVSLTQPSAGFTDFAELISEAINIIFVVAAIAVLIYLFIGAFTYLTAGDSEDNVAKARKQITNAVIGLLILASAYAIWQFIIGFIPDLDTLIQG